MHPIRYIGARIGEKSVDPLTLTEMVLYTIPSHARHDFENMSEFRSTKNAGIRSYTSLTGRNVADFIFFEF